MTLLDAITSSTGTALGAGGGLISIATAIGLVVRALIRWRERRDHHAAQLATVEVEAEATVAVAEAERDASIAERLIGRIQDLEKRIDARDERLTAAMQELERIKRELEDCTRKHAAADERARALQQRVEELEREVANASDVAERVGAKALGEDDTTVRRLRQTRRTPSQPMAAQPEDEDRWEPKT